MRLTYGKYRYLPFPETVLMCANRDLALL